MTATSEFKVGDKVKVRNSGRGIDGWVGDVEKIDKKIIYVRFKEEGYSLGFYGEELEVIATPPTQTKMLHELITLAKAGVKFKAYCKVRSDVISVTQDSFLESTRQPVSNSWTIEEIITPWQYEEIKEPRVVEFEATVTEINSLAVNLGNFYIFHDSMKELAGRKVKVVATEVIE